MQKRTYYGMLFIFTLSGFSGLIYESIWSHYLKLFLGHSAYAQTLVLAIFMGGVALGAWICSRYSSRWKNLLLGYAAAEGLIGLFAMAFHTVFDRAIRFSYATVIPGLDSAAFTLLYKWTLSALLILPQSVLLGMTFPLMTAGVLRLAPRHPGKTIALLYFTNSLGAAVGVLVSGFLLIRLSGLPGTVGIAGLINILLALTVWSLIRSKEGNAHHAQHRTVRTAEAAPRRRYALLLAASCITGASSFMYEIGWIRMLGLVLGTSTHAFELMLSAFIFGLAFGGLWIQHRIDRLAVPERALGYLQICMGIFALATLPLYGWSFEVMQALLQTLSRTEEGYAAFNLASNGIALAIMLPATFCAGMTLPLITYALLREGRGEASIGAVYAANTLGAIVGVFFAIHIGMPVLGLKGLIVFGASCDLALGVLLLWLAADYLSVRIPSLVSAASVCAVLLAVLLAGLDPYKMSSGVYRMGRMLSPETTEVRYYQDGKTATIAVHRDKATGAVTIATNGKPDASLRIPLDRPATSDEPTMILLGVLPMALHPRAETAANIGLGSGLTTQMLLNNPRLRQVDTVEIEEAVVTAAQHFRPRVEQVYTDPRSAIYIDDAKTFFSLHRKTYDIIISEPSNPWVSGVAGLFTEEFYRLVSRHLAADGLFVQWVQLYEIDVELVMSILKAVSREFSDYTLYSAGVGDMLIIAKRSGTLPGPDSGVFAIPRIAAELERVHVRSVQDIEIRRIGNKALMKRLSATFDIRANSDYYPVVDQEAVRTRFLQTNAFAIRGLAHDWMPTTELLTDVRPGWRRTAVTPSPFVPESEPAHAAMGMRDYVLRRGGSPNNSAPVQEIPAQAVELRQAFHDCRKGVPAEVGGTAFRAAALMTPYLTPEELGAVWAALESGPCTAYRSAEEKDWISLFKAVGARDADAMTRLAGAMLRRDAGMSPEARNYAVAAGMVGHLMSGGRDAAFQLWSDNRDRMSPDAQPGLLFRLLVAESADVE